MSRILVTGGAGYIGSHTIVDLMESNHDILCVDNLSRSDGSLLDGIEKITGKKVSFTKVDLSDRKQVEELFDKEKGIESIIHFAAYKSVPESIDNPLEYFKNNLDSLMYLLEMAEQYKVKNFIFSSSCSVYGNIETLPVREETPMNMAQSPYARTKQIGEMIIEDVARVSGINFIILRYFNPVGAHESGYIGEISSGKFSNLVSAIVQTALGKNKLFTIFGNDYPTRDGTCIRDYVHIMDIANAHTKALEYLENKKNKSKYEVYNLGSGKGVSVKEMVETFERISDMKLNYVYGPRREGDVVEIYSDNSRACKILGWEIKRNLDTMMSSAWGWEKNYESKIQ